MHLRTDSCHNIQVMVNLEQTFLASRQLQLVVIFAVCVGFLVCAGALAKFLKISAVQTPRAASYDVELQQTQQTPARLPTQPGVAEVAEEAVQEMQLQKKTPTAVQFYAPGEAMPFSNVVVSPPRPRYSMHGDGQEDNSV